MKTNNIFNLLVLISFLGIIITSCKKDEKEEENKDNFAAAFSGTYTGNVNDNYGNSGQATTTITRINNNLINLQFNGSSTFTTRCLDSVNVNTASTFSINEFDGCFGERATGGGSLTGSTLNYTWTQVGGSAESITFTGTK